MTLREEIAWALASRALTSHVGATRDATEAIMRVLARRLDPEALARVLWSVDVDVEKHPWETAACDEERVLFRKMAAAVIAHVTGEPTQGGA